MMTNLSFASKKAMRLSYLLSIAPFLLVTTVSAFAEVHLSTHIRAANNCLLALAARSRRQFFESVVPTTASSMIPMLTLLDPSMSQAADGAQNLQNGLLETRVLDNVLSTPPYGMEGNDIYYPDYFSGLWSVESRTSDVAAPCGIALFGGNQTYARALGEINTSLNYNARFIVSPSERTNMLDNSANVIADREFNVREIAKAAMGSNSVLDVPLSSPNKVSVVLTPSGANQILKADLLTLNRRSELINNCEFHCSEVVRQVIAPARASSGTPMSQPSKSTLLKEIETTSLYTAIRDDVDGRVREIRCRQRSATFILPSQQDPIAYKMWEASRGRPIDVRFYDVVYHR